MEVFSTLLIKLIPLYIMIFLGFLGGKYLQIKKESIANLVIFLVAPVIFFHGVYTASISVENIALPFIVLGICCIICLLFYLLGSFFWRDSLRNTLAFIASDGNTGYFGIPVAILLLPSQSVSLFILSGLGVVLYESTLGFFIAARGKSSVKESFLKLFKLPIIYCVVLGLAANILSVHFPSGYTDIITSFKGAYTILGMMMIGLGIADISTYKFDFLFTSLSFFAKFVIWPLIAFIFIFIDSNFLKIYNKDIYHILFLIAIVPLAANTVSITTFLKSNPEKVSLAVLLSTVFALIYIPLFVTFFLK